MSINGIGTANISSGYEMKRNTGNNAAKSNEFMQTVQEKTENNTTPKTAEYYAEQAFASVGSKAPEEVKKAWMEAARQTGANGLGIGGGGMMTHISQMMIQRVKKSWLNGGADDNDILGSSVSSAIAAAKQALYDLENPLTADHPRSMEVQRSRMQEKAFYQAFIEKLESGKERA